jgi:hypothetical protein
MAVVTITEILGGDNIAASRVVLNNNFTLLQNAVNTLETRLNTSYTPGGSLNVGSIQALKYTRAITTNIFLVQASAQIDGNLSIGTATNPNAILNVTGSITVSQALTVAGDLTFSNDGGTKVFTNNAQTVINDSFSNAQWAGPTAKQAEQLISTGGTHTIAITDNTNVIRLDITAVVAATILSLPSATAFQGQVVTLAFDSDYKTIANRAFTLAIANLDPAYAAAPLALNNGIDSSTDAIGKVWITLVAANNGWRVIGASPSVTNW